MNSVYFPQLLRNQRLSSGVVSVQMPHMADIADMAVMPQTQIVRDVGAGRIADSTSCDRAYGTADNRAGNSAEQQVVYTLTRAGGGGNKQKSGCKYHSDQGSHDLCLLSISSIDILTQGAR